MKKALIFLIGIIISLIATGQETTKVAVLDIEKGAGTTKEEANTMTNWVSRFFTGDPRFEVVDRKHLDRILEEQKLQMSGLVNNDDLVEVGNLSGVQLFVMGRLTEDDKNWYISLKVLDVATGKITKEDKESFKKTFDKKGNQKWDIGEETWQIGSFLKYRLFKLSEDEKEAKEQARINEYIKNIPKLNKEVSGIEQGTFKDTRDGKSYKTVKIGDQTWMAQNFSYEDVKGVKKGSIRYNQNVNGLYYNWKGAQKACPKGWHLPSKEDFEALRAYIAETYNYDLASYVGYYLKSKEEWGEKAGDDPFGFDVIPSGFYRTPRPVFPQAWRSAGKEARFWTSTKEGKYTIYYSLDDHDLGALSPKQEDDTKEIYMSVRYIKDK